jgi:AraC family transcriptional regulator
MAMTWFATSGALHAAKDRAALARANRLRSENSPGEEEDGRQCKREYVSLLTEQGPFDAITSRISFSPPEIVTRRAVTWNGMAAEAVQTTENRKIEGRFCAPIHLLALFEAGERNEGFTFVEGLPPSTLRSYEGKLIFVPAGHEFYDWQKPRSPSRAAHFYFDPAALPVNPDERSGAVSFSPRLFFEDAALWDIAIKLKALVEGARAQDRLSCEALGIMLAQELVRLNLGADRAGPPVRGGLAAWQERTVAQYIEEHLAEGISLSTLARLVRLSPCHFNRAFRQSFGMPPHRFHMYRRIEHAKSLLANLAASVTDVAFDLGFSETGSFTSTFRKVTGLTPTHYRRSVI